MYRIKIGDWDCIVTFRYHEVDAVHNGWRTRRLLTECYIRGAINDALLAWGTAVKHPREPNVHKSIAREVSFGKALSDSEAFRHLTKSERKSLVKRVRTPVKRKPRHIVQHEFEWNGNRYTVSYWHIFPNGSNDMQVWGADCGTFVHVHVWRPSVKIVSPKLQLFICARGRSEFRLPADHTFNKRLGRKIALGRALKAGYFAGMDDKDRKRILFEAA